MEKVIKKELCKFCEHKENCLKIKLIKDGYTCENYKRNKDIIVDKFDYEIRSDL